MDSFSDNYYEDNCEELEDAETSQPELIHMPTANPDSWLDMEIPDDIDSPERQTLWHSLVDELATFDIDDERAYEIQIQDAFGELGQAPPDGVIVGVVRPDGERITRKFDREMLARSLYIWAAADEKMVKEMITPGTFVILREDWTPIRPTNRIGDECPGRSVILNIRLLDW
jgi:hypothetical protein